MQGSPETLLACSRIEPLLEAFLDDALNPGDALNVRIHLATCDRCTARLAALAETDRLVAQVPVPRVGSELRDRLYARIRASEREQPASAASHRSSPDRRIALIGARLFPRTVIRPSFRAGFATLVAASLVVALFATVLYSHGAGQHSVQQLSFHATAAPSPRVWRAAYLAADGKLHLVSAAGDTTTGPTMPDAFVTQPNGVVDEASSPDGRYVAYTECMNNCATNREFYGPLFIYDAISGNAVSPSATQPMHDLAWAPDGSKIAAIVGGYSPVLAFVNPHDGSTKALTAPSDIFRVLGWTDASHVAVVLRHLATAAASQTFGSALVNYGMRALTALSTPQNASSDTPDVDLGDVDVDTGTLRLISPLPRNSDAFLTPDGSNLLVLPSWSDPAARLIDLSTGTVHPLPGIAKALSGIFAHIAGGLPASSGNWALRGVWRPGTHTIAVSLADIPTGSTSNSGGGSQSPGVWLLDADGDTATQIGEGVYPLAWLPDGTTLISCTPPPSVVPAAADAGCGSDLLAVSPYAPGAPMHQLTNVLVAYLGLVCSS